MKNSSAVRMKQLSELAGDLSDEATAEISGALRTLLADVFALYLKTKNFHWHMSGKHFRDYHLLLDEHATQVFAMTDDTGQYRIGNVPSGTYNLIAWNEGLASDPKPVTIPEGGVTEVDFTLR